MRNLELQEHATRDLVELSMVERDALLELEADLSITPVRGQLTRLIPQTEVGYGLFYKSVSVVPRRDGLVFQVVGDNDYYGYDDETAVPDRTEAEHAVSTIASLFAAT